MFKISKYSNTHDVGWVLKFLRKLRENYLAWGNRTYSQSRMVLEIFQPKYGNGVSTIVIIKLS